MGNIMRVIVANITWNSNDWKSETSDVSNHRYVNGGNVPHESWNFDFDNDRNSDDIIRGYAYFRGNPKHFIGGNDFLLFYSKGKIVGFYGKASHIKKDHKIDPSPWLAYGCNLEGSKSLSIVLKNKIDAKDFLEDKIRVGQCGFIYLNYKENVINIIDEAIKLNDDPKLLDIKKWFIDQNMEFDPNRSMVKRIGSIFSKKKADILAAKYIVGCKKYSDLNKSELSEIIFKKFGDNDKTSKYMNLFSFRDVPSDIIRSCRL